MFALLASLGHFAVDTEREGLAQNRRNEVTQATLAMVSRLDAEINANVSLANGMYALISALPGAGADQLRNGLQALYRFGRHVRYVSLAPDNRISQIYPPAGNEAAIGLYYPDLPEQWPAVKRAMDQRANVLAGPVRLPQGGFALICRTPVFEEDGGYWGMLNLALEADGLFRDVGLAPELAGVRYALRGRDGAGEAGEVFFGDADTFSADAVRVPFRVPGGTWVLAARPAKGWSAGQGHLAALEAAAVVAAMALALGFYGFQRGRLRIEDREKRLRAFLDTARDGVIVIDEHGIIREFNPAAENLFGYTAGEVLGTSLNRLMPAGDALQHDRRLRETRQPGVRRMGGGRQIEGRRGDGSTFPAEISVGNVTIGEERLFVGVVRDITQRKEYERRLMELANTDGLTKTLNRRALLEEGESQLELARRHGRPLSLMMIDADHFKKVNDVHGHHVGDAVLVRLADVVRGCLRGTDRLGRLGGEEFAVLMPETDREQAEAVAQRLLRAIRETEVATDTGAALRFTVSIGLAGLETATEDLAALLRAADAALYRAKAEGRDRHSVAEAET